MAACLNPTLVPHPASKRLTKPASRTVAHVLQFKGGEAEFVPTKLMTRLTYTLDEARLAAQSGPEWLLASACLPSNWNALVQCRPTCPMSAGMPATVATAWRSPHMLCVRCPPFLLLLLLAVDERQLQG